MPVYSVYVLQYREQWLLTGFNIQALAIKIYSIAINSMEDERTMSVITWLNSLRRSRQLVSTVQNLVKIRKWHRYDPDVSIATTESYYNVIDQYCIPEICSQAFSNSKMA
jgi:hypothetical protein